MYTWVLTSSAPDSSLLSNWAGVKFAPWELDHSCCQLTVFLLLGELFPHARTLVYPYNTRTTWHEQCCRMKMPQPMMRQKSAPTPPTKIRTSYQPIVPHSMITSMCYYTMIIISAISHGSIYAKSNRCLFLLFICTQQHYICDDSTPATCCTLDVTYMCICTLALSITFIFDFSKM